MRLIKEFDPWKSKLCTCPPKYTFNPYTGCKFSCRYCYITSYIKDGFHPRKKEIDLYTFERDVAKLSKLKMPIALSLSTDAYQPLEAKYGITRKLLKILRRYDIPTLITTKSPLIIRDLDLLKEMNVVVSITITTLDDFKASKLEPYAPRPSARLKAIKKLSENGIPVVVRIDPIIPTITDDIYEIGNDVKEYKEAGAKHIVASIYKSKPDSLKRLISEFPDFKYIYREIYGVGKKINGYRYPDKNYSYRKLLQISEVARKYGFTFNTCRDGLSNLDSPNCYCDGSHMLNKRIPIK